MIRSQTDLDAARAAGLRSLQPDRPRIAIGMGSCGLAAGADEVHEALVRALRERGVHAALVGTGCLGFCEQEPIVDVRLPGQPRVVYQQIEASKAASLAEAIAANRPKLDWALCWMDEEEPMTDGTPMPATGADGNGQLDGLPRYREIPFFQKQQKVVMRNCGFVNPRSIDEYIARGGYYPLYRVVTEMTPEQVIAEIEASGLRGRGGAGFPTGRKWRACRDAPSDVRYLICNGDEGDPGAYMDRSILEGDPHGVLEGVLIGAYAVGAREGYIYVRDEYPLAVATMEHAIAQAEERGLLGDNIMGRGFDFHVALVRGAGAFVCGEETALIESVEGRVGEPRQRPPFPAHKGVWEEPTVINNVKTWANVPVIIARGARWFSSFGTPKSKGTMVFSLVGKVRNTGLVEVPMGIRLRDLVHEIGGGLLDDREFKAVQTGGPSGGCIPAELIDLPVDYERLTEAGSMMGSGGMVVMDDTTCMVDVAKYFLTFTKDESCGKCTPCREGTRRMLEILTRITEGKGRSDDLELLEDLATAVKDASLCGLGSTAPNPVLTTIRYFRDEYEAHIKHKRCPAAVCRPLIEYYIIPEKCEFCALCQTIENCTEQAIVGKGKKPRRIIQEKCIKCGVCLEVCDYDAVRVE